MNFVLLTKHGVSILNKEEWEPRTSCMIGLYGYCAKYDSKPVQNMPTLYGNGCKIPTMSFVYWWPLMGFGNCHWKQRRFS